MRANYLLPFFLAIGFILVLPTSNFAQGRLLRKLKEKAEDKLIEKVFGEDESSKNTNDQTYNGSTNGYEKGKKLTPPDVNENIVAAETAVAAEDYSAAKFAIQQAMTGVELEIGYDILDNAPETVLEMNYVAEDDQVVTTGYGFLGLVIGRSYKSKKKEMTFQVMNNNAMVNLYSGMLTNASYASSEGDQKKVDVDGNEGVLRYENGNYELGIPLGQASILILSCEGFSDEAEVLAAAKVFKVNEIKQRLGEQ